MLTALISFLAAPPPGVVDVAMWVLGWFAAYLVTKHAFWPILAKFVQPERRDVPSVAPVPLPKPQGGRFAATGLKSEDPLGATEITGFCPASLELLGKIPVDTAADVQEKALKAREAQAEWVKTSWAERRRVMRTVKKYVLENRETLVRASCLDTAKTRTCDRPAPLSLPWRIPLFPPLLGFY
jgi:Aldehyde dehydrogenase family